MERKIWIDVMKGMGIISVVAGHIFQGKIIEIIYLFHMPLFFFIGGYLFKPNQDIKKNFHAKASHLLVPYCVFLIIIYFTFCLPSLNGLTAKEMFVVLFLRPVFLRSFLGNRFNSGAGFLAVFWFPTCFFLVQQLTNALVVKTSKRQTLIISVAMLALSYINSLVMPRFFLPWGGHILLAALPLYYAGYLYKTGHYNLNRLSVCILSVLVIASEFVLKNNRYDMVRVNYGIPLVTFFSSLIIILFIKEFAVKIAKFNAIALLLAEFGKASMVVMYTHQAIQITTGHYIKNNPEFRFFFSLILSYLLYILIKKFRLSRALLLGLKKDQTQVKADVQKYLSVW